MRRASPSRRTRVPFSTDEYESFLQLLSGDLATTIANARAYEEEKRRAEALAELDRAKTVFFSNISHEFRTPLTLMLGPVDNLLARSHTDLSPTTKGQLEIVNRNGLRLLRLVNSLLDFSRIEAGRVQARYEPTDLSGFTAELASSFRSATERAGLDLVVQCPPLNEPVYVDRDMWEKIVLNLLSNAFKYTFEGHITVTLAAAEGGAELCVRDTGVGIPPDHLPRIFERFHRVDNTRSRTHEGSGIGLALVQELVKLHGGRVGVESVLGQGTTFRVVIPFGTDHLPADSIARGRSVASTAMGAGPFVEEALRWLPEMEASFEMGEVPARDELLPVPCPPSAEEHGGERPYILVADDNADMRQYVARLLAERYRVEAVADGEAALAAARTGRPELILSDVMMPRLDGFGLLRALRSDEATKTIPVILLSARAGEESRIEGMEHGADDYLIKPFSARELLARVQAHLELARVRKDAQQEIARNKLFLERIADTMPDLLWIYDLLSGRNVYVNRGVAQVLGYQMEDIQSYPGDVTEYLVHPDDLAAVRDWYVGLDSVGEGEVREIESRVRHADGSYRWMHSHATVFERAPDGRAKLILGISSDISQRKHAEHERHVQMAQLRQQAEILNLAHLVIRDMGDRIVQWNVGAEQLYGFDRAEAIGRVSHDLLHTVFPQPLDVIKQALYRDGTWQGELIHWTKDGRALVVMSSWVLHRNESGEPVAILEVNSDATERKKAEHALRRLNDELEHRVEERTRELVQSYGRLRALATELNLTEQRERDRLATELHDHLQQMLVLAKLNLGQGKALAEAIPQCANTMKEVNEILSESLQYTRTLVAELSPPVLREHGLPAGLKWLGEYMKKHHMLVTVTVPDQETITLPKNQAVLLFQSVRELLMNAHKYAETGEATVTLAREEGRLRIDVRDQGVGFDFSNATATSGAAGSKFGLFSIRERMKALGGEFHLQSARGKGTTATLILPLEMVQVPAEGGDRKEAEPSSKERVPPRETSGEPVPERDGSSSVRVLLVDDHLMVRQGLRTMLEAFSDITVVGEARDGEEALVLVERLQPRVVIMDINMPRMNGIEATAHITERYPSTIVIGLTVNAGEENRKSMVNADAALLLTKEAAVEQLYSAIQETLQAGNCRS